MKKKHFYILVFIFVLLFFLNPIKDSAQTVDPSFSDRQYDQEWSCVHIDQDGPVRQNTLEQGVYFPESPVRLSGNCNGTSCEVVICATLGSAQKKGEKCHDRDLQMDQSEIPSYCYEHCWKNGDTNLSDELKGAFARAISAQAGAGHQFTPNQAVGFMPRLVTADSTHSLITSFPSGQFSEIPAILENAHRHAIFLIFAAPSGSPVPTVIPLSPLPTINETNSTQQLGILNFSQTIIQVGDGNPQQCTMILWDPYGRVFDAKSLEPLGEEEAVVTLLDKNNNKINLPTNDDSLDIFGLYNILVIKDGEYKLKVAPKTNHSFEPVEVNPLYKDIYEFIYKAGDPPFFESANDPKRVDIPLKAKETAYSRSIEIGKMSQKDIVGGTQLIIKVTHPLSLVKVFSNGKQLADNGYGQPIPNKTDKSGVWQAVIKKNLLSQYGYSLEISKNPKYFKTGIVIDNETGSEIFSKVTADFPPLLTYIEGFAYDKNQKIIPNAKVNVIVKMDKSIYYQTTTDSSGFFTIYGKNLPFLEYYLEFIDPKTQVKLIQSTYQFIKNNKDYIKSENLDLLNGTKNNQPIINPITKELNTTLRNDFDSNKKDYKIKSEIKNFSNTKFFPLLIIIVSIILFAALTFGVVLYIKKIKANS